MSVTTEISWDDGSGDKLYFTREASEGDQVVLVSSDANSGEQREKSVTFSAEGAPPQSLGIVQLGSGASGEGGGPIPYGYRPLRYVETDSDAYINTGVSGNNDSLVIDSIFEVGSYVQNGYIFGNYQEGTHDIFFGTLSNGNIDATGVVYNTPDNFLHCDEYIPVTPSKAYALFTTLVSGSKCSQLVLLEFNAAKACIARRGISSGSELATRNANFTTNAAASYIKFLLYSANAIDGTGAQISIEEGATTDAENSVRMLLQSSSALNYNMNSRSGNSGSVPFITGAKLCVHLAYNALIWGYSQYALTPTAGAVNHNVICIGKGSPTTPKRNIGLKIYWFRLEDNGAVLMELLPCQRVSDDVVGFYDLVSNTFKPSDSSVAFAAGPVIDHGSTVIEDLLSEI